MVTRTEFFVGLEPRRDKGIWPVENTIDAICSDKSEARVHRWSGARPALESWFQLHEPRVRQAA